MATVRALSLALLLAFCFAACGCAAAQMMPKKMCPNRPVPIPTEPGVTTAAAGSKVDHSSHVALLTGKQLPALMMAGAKTGAAESKTKYISPAALAANKPCVGRRCPSHDHP